MRWISLLRIRLHGEIRTFVAPHSQFSLVLANCSELKVCRKLERMTKWLPLLLLGIATAFSLFAFFYDRFPGDLFLIRHVQLWDQPMLTAIMEMVSFIGKGWPMIALAVVVSACFFVVNRRRECYTALCALGIMGLSPLLKLLIDRPRPPADLVEVAQTFGGLGYPSGHAFQALVLFGLLIYLCSISISRPWLRTSIQGALGLLILTIGISRIYLGAHWPSDVLGGYLLGGAFLLPLLKVYGAKAGQTARIRPAA